MTRPPDDTALRARVLAAERLLERTHRELAVIEDEIRAIEDGARRPGRGPEAGAGPAISPGAPLLSEIEMYRRRLEAVYASTSWRITRPLRALSRRLRGDSTEPDLLPPPPSAAIARWWADALSGGRTPVSVTRPRGCAPTDRNRRRIALVVAASPEGAAGGAELFYWELAEALERAGCTVETVAVPVDERSFDTIQDAYRDIEGLDLDGFDCVISTKAPTYAVFHPNHIVYLVHTVRVFYDMFEPSPDALRACQRDWIHRADAEAIGRARARFAIGREVADRLREASGIAADVLHPGRDQGGFRTEGYGDYFFLPGRLHPWKRVDLAIRAVLASKLPMRLLIAGDGESDAALRALADDDPRITFLGRVSDDKVREHYAACLAVPFLPLREDYGYVTIEAFASGKAVVTCRDSGEPARIVAHEADGLVADPTVPAIRDALERLWRDRALAESLGTAARERAKDFTWDATAAALLAAAFDEPAAEPEPPTIRVAVLDMQPITPPLAGGRARLLGLYGDLGPGFETRYVGSFDWPDEARRSEQLTPRLTETVVPLSEAHHAAAREATARVAGRTVIDALFGQHAHLSPDYLAAVEDAVSSADVVVVSHPWVAPLLAPSRLAGKRVIYDAHNCEGRLKAQLFDRTVPAEADVVDYVVACESALGARADLVIACSEEDRAAFVADYGWDRTRIHVVPNGAFACDVPVPDADERRAARAGLGLADDLVVAIFIGSDFAPNIEAAAFIAGPLARGAPGIRFVIAGGCADRLADIDANCWRAGTLSEDAKRLWLAAADIALNPVVSGSGTNVKMFDYMAHGLPILSTPVGARGIVAGTEAGIVVAERDGFAAALSSMAARAPAFRRGLGRANRALVARDFDWHTISARLGRILRRTVHADAAAAPRRLAHLTTMGLRCGIGEYTRKLVAALAADGATNLVMTAFADGAVPDLAALPQPAVIAWNQDNIHGRYAEILPTASEALAEFGADMLVVQYHPGFLSRGDVEQFVRRAAVLGMATRMVVHSYVAADAPLMRRLAALGCCLFSHSPTEVGRAAAAGVPLVHLPMPVEGRTATPAPRDRPPGPRLVANGFMRRYKGFRHLIDAMPAILEGYPDASLVLYAPPYPTADSDEERAACLHRIEQLGLGATVTIDATFHEYPALLDRIAEADLAVLPYDDSLEGGSAAAGDCIAAGTPLVVSRAAIFDGVRIASVTIDADPLAIAHAVLRLLSEPETLARLRDAGTRYRAQNSWRHAVERLTRPG